VSPSETPNAELSASAATSETSCGARRQPKLPPSRSTSRADLPEPEG